MIHPQSNRKLAGCNFATVLKPVTDLRVSFGYSQTMAQICSIRHRRTNGPTFCDVIVKAHHGPD